VPPPNCTIPDTFNEFPESFFGAVVSAEVAGFAGIVSGEDEGFFAVVSCEKENE